VAFPRNAKESQSESDRLFSRAARWWIPLAIRRTLSTFEPRWPAPGNQVTTRRAFLGSAAGPCLLYVASVHAQNAVAMRRIGVLEFNSLAESTVGPLDLGLRELGWVEGRNLVIERRYADVDRSRIAA